MVGHAGYVCVDRLGRRERTRNRYASSSAMYGTVRYPFPSQPCQPRIFARLLAQRRRRDGGCPQPWETRRSFRDTEVTAVGSPLLSSHLAMQRSCGAVVHRILALVYRLRLSELLGQQLLRAFHALEW